MLHGLSQFTPESFLTMYDNLEFLFRIVLAAFLGGCIGFERSKRSKEAGIRTHCIVALTSAAFMIVSKYAFLDLGDIPGSRGADSARIAAQVVSGISFIGAGIIFKQGRAGVKGLTTAAGIWATGAIGIAVGAGLYWVGVMQTVIILCAQYLLHSHTTGEDNSGEQEIVIYMKEKSGSVEDFHALLENHGGKIEDIKVQRKGEMLEMSMTAVLDRIITADEVIKFMDEHADVTEFSI